MLNIKSAVIKYHIIQELNHEVQITVFVQLILFLKVELKKKFFL
jgi:hypothetical protein